VVIAGQNGQAAPSVSVRHRVGDREPPKFRVEPEHRLPGTCERELDSVELNMFAGRNPGSFELSARVAEQPDIGDALFRIIRAAALPFAKAQCGILNLEGNPAAVGSNSQDISDTGARPIDRHFDVGLRGWVLAAQPIPDNDLALLMVDRLRGVFLTAGEMRETITSMRARYRFQLRHRTIREEATQFIPSERTHVLRLAVLHNEQLTHAIFVLEGSHNQARVTGTHEPPDLIRGVETSRHGLMLTIATVGVDAKRTKGAIVLTTTCASQVPVARQDLLFIHSSEPQPLDKVPSGHPLRGFDLRKFTDEQLAEAATREILPNIDRLFSWSSTPTSSVPADLAGTVVRRVTRILVQRTKIVRFVASGHIDLEMQDELLEAVTLCFLHIAGAFDALAIINGVLAGESNYSMMGWQKSDFRHRIRAFAPKAVALFDKETAGNRYLGAVLSFRNTVHRRMPDTGQSGVHRGDPAHQRAVLVLERGSHAEIFDSFNAAAWTRFVGITPVGNEYLVLRHDTLIDCLLNGGIPLLNALLKALVETFDPNGPVVESDRGLYPRQMRNYAVRYLRLKHLIAETTGSPFDS
jgi:hypothetical protein